MAKKIKIAIDVSPTQDGNALRGVGYYTSNLVSALQTEIKTNPLYKNYQIDLITDICHLKSEIYNLIHYPYFDPFKLTLPKKTNIPTIVTVHDLIPRQFKKYFPVGIKGEIKWFIQKHRLLKVDKILTVSNYSKNIINKITGYPLQNIFATHLAADSSFKVLTDSKKLKEIQKKYKLPNKFVLFVGDINWNKNIPTLVNACLKLKYPLVIVGSSATKKDVPNHPWTQDLLWLQSQKSPNLILTGFVPDEDLPIIFNLATLYCQPSFAEGFGLPLVQAMSSGCPVVYSQDSCLDEIMESNGLKFNPHSQKDLEKKLEQFWINKELRQKYINLGLIRAKSFDWKNTAIQTLALYNLTLSNEK
ncbi:MAG: glycosyltransferase family 1 protein [Candidatus Shapirobacteria bacterium]|jgi:glycosyltransferase involved in cell wall biosynthesis|nr:glycosyltransferase family 1 protein [Candidatus Shapirobacteria bacterium]